MRLFTGGLKRVRDTWRETSFTQFINKNNHKKAAKLLVKAKDSPFLVDGEFALKLALEDSSDKYMPLLEEINKYPDSSQIYTTAVQVTRRIYSESDVTGHFCCVHWQEGCFQENERGEDYFRSRTGAGQSADTFCFELLG